MARTERRTATYDAAVIEATERLRTASEYRRALIELAGREPQTESALFNDLAKIAHAVIERRAQEIGYRQLAESDRGERAPVDRFLEEQALAAFDHEDEDDPTALLDYLARDAT
jgi:hypothetical protein